MLKILQGNDVPESFWANTSGNDIIYQYIQKADSQMRTDFDTLISGGRITQTVRYELTYREMDQINNIYSFLLFTGYLKAIACVDKDKAVYQLMIPNKEINRIYTLIFEEWFQEQVKAKSRTLVDAFMKEDVETANEVLNTILFKSISYFDYDEKFYHGMLVGMLSDYQIVSNQETGNGRSDIMVLPAYKKKRGLVLEVKVATKEKDIEITAQKACHQIREMNYIDGLQERGYTDIIGYGIAFYKKTCVIMLAK